MSETDKVPGRGAYRSGIAIAALASFLIVWTTIVRDDGSGAGNFMVILAAGVGAFAARFQPDGMARGMVGVAAMQATLGMLTATAPITAAEPDGVFKTVLFSAVFTALWLVSAAFFHHSGKRTLA